jgi:beta-phosphoglucomutase-like phosphatase (HAD superfamily)
VGRAHHVTVHAVAGGGDRAHDATHPRRARPAAAAPGRARGARRRSGPGLRVGLATGQDLERLPGRLARLEIHEHCDAVVTAEEVPRGKPHPDIFLEAARRLEVDPSACLVLEDSVPGCEAALAAGMRVVACPSSVTAHCTFPAEARRVTSLLELLGGEGGI